MRKVERLVSRGGLNEGKEEKKEKKGEGGGGGGSSKTDRFDFNVDANDQWSIGIIMASFLF